MVQGTQQQEQPVLVGTSLPRLDGPDKVTGHARYAGDQAVPGMLYARLVHSPYAHARILAIDTSAALAVPGVVAVFTAETLGMSRSNPLSRAQSPLFEGMTYDEDGQLLTSTLMDYALPLGKDVPTITPLVVEVPSALGPFGARGVGEPPVVPVAAAIANAIKDAVGVRMTEMPITPERVLVSLQGNSGLT